jgi:hypothetical protein
MVDIKYQHWIGPSGKEFGLLKQVVRGSISGSYVWKKFGWEGENTPCVPHRFFDEN